jgi:hypothetical protein
MSDNQTVTVLPVEGQHGLHDIIDAGRVEIRVTRQCIDEDGAWCSRRKNVRKIERHPLPRRV